jgi:hypothetical protein
MVSLPTWRVSARIETAERLSIALANSSTDRPNWSQTAQAARAFSTLPGARQRKPHGPALDREGAVSARADDILSPVARVRRFAERAERPALGATSRDEGLDVAVDDEHIAGSLAFRDRELLADDRRQIPEALQVGRMGVGDDRDVGQGDPRQLGDLAGMVGPDLSDDHLVLRLCAQQSQGQADVVVEALLGLMRAESLAQDVVDDLAGRGLADRPGDGHHFEGVHQPVRAGEIAEGSNRI